MRVFSSLTKNAQSFLDELEDVEWDNGHGDQGIIDSDNYEDFLADEREKEEAANYNPEVGVEPGYQPASDVSMADGVIYRSEEGKTPIELVYDGIDQQELIEFGYTTRHGRDTGNRLVEPHYTFIASTTGNEVLVSYDLTPGIDEAKGRIRAFIVGNIHPDGKRYRGDAFKPRGEIMKGVY